MMKKLTSILFLMVAICAMAQTNIFVVYSFLDGSGNPETVRQISFTPLTVNALGNSIITSNTITRVVTGTNYTNSMISGIAYEVKYYSAAYPPVPIADFTNYFPTTIPANSVVNSTAYMSFGFAWGTSTTGSGGGSTNLFNSDFTTNAGLIAVSPTSPTVTAIATNLFGFGATGLFGVLEAPALYFGGLVSGGAMLNGFIGLNGKLYDTNGVKFYDSANNTFSGTLNGNATSITGTIPAAQVTGGVVTNVQGGFCLYVDAVNGNDSTALRGRIDKPFLTFTNAVANSKSGDSVVLYAGQTNVVYSAVMVSNLTIIGYGSYLTLTNITGQDLLYANGSLNIYGGTYSHNSGTNYGYDINVAATNAFINLYNAVFNGITDCNNYSGSNITINAVSCDFNTAWDNSNTGAGTKGTFRGCRIHSDPNGLVGTPTGLGFVNTGISWSSGGLFKYMNCDIICSNATGVVEGIYDANSAATIELDNCTIELGSTNANCTIVPVALNGGTSSANVILNNTLINGVLANAIPLTSSAQQSFNCPSNYINSKMVIVQGSWSSLVDGTYVLRDTNAATGQAVYTNIIASHTNLVVFQDSGVNESPTSWVIEATTNNPVAILFSSVSGNTPLPLWLSSATAPAINQAYATYGPVASSSVTTSGIIASNITATGTLTGNGGGLTNLNSTNLVGTITATASGVVSVGSGVGSVAAQTYYTDNSGNSDTSFNIYGVTIGGNGGGRDVAFRSSNVGGVDLRLHRHASGGLEINNGTTGVLTNCYALSFIATNGFVSYATNRTLVPVVATGITNTLGVTGYLPVTAATGLVRYDCQSNVVSTATTVTSQYDVILQPGGWATWTTVTTNGQFHAW